MTFFWYNRKQNRSDSCDRQVEWLWTMPLICASTL